jgi:hypothetical protein
MIEHRGHSALRCDLGNGAGVAAAADQFADLIGRLKHLKNAGAAAVTGTAAMVTAAGFVHGFSNAQAKHGIPWIVGEVCGGQPPFNLTTIAEYANKPLSDHGA